MATQGCVQLIDIVDRFAVGMIDDAEHWNRLQAGASLDMTWA